MRVRGRLGIIRPNVCPIMVRAPTDASLKRGTCPNTLRAISSTETFGSGAVDVITDAETGGMYQHRRNSGHAELIGKPSSSL
jgi:hypothetical protein